MYKAIVYECLTNKTQMVVDRFILMSFQLMSIPLGEKKPNR